MEVGFDHLNSLYNKQPESDVYSPKKQAELAKFRAQLARLGDLLVILRDWVGLSLRGGGGDARLRFAWLDCDGVVTFSVFASNWLSRASAVAAGHLSITADLVFSTAEASQSAGGRGGGRRGSTVPVTAQGALDVAGDAGINKPVVAVASMLPLHIKPLLVPGKSLGHDVELVAAFFVDVDGGRNVAQSQVCVANSRGGSGEAQQQVSYLGDGLCADSSCNGGDVVTAEALDSGEEGSLLFGGPC